MPDPGRAVSRLFGRVILALSTLLFPAGAAWGSQEAPKPVRIGVLAKRGPQRCLAKWGPTAQYLTSAIPECSFAIVPLEHDEIHPAVERGEVDFVLANPSLYVGLERLYGASRILTLKNLRLGKAYTVYGGVIFCRADRQDIESLSDLRGKTFMAVEETSLGGWHAAWLELKEHGIDPYRDLADLRFGGTHDAVVYAVHGGQVDAGTVRTDTLERMTQEGRIRLEGFRVIRENHRDPAHLPFLHSTRLYPEWPLAKAEDTSGELAEKVTAALLKMSADTPAARAARCAGWTIPHNYQPVHECLKTLRVTPYEDYGKVTPADVFRQYWPWLLGAVAAAALTVLFAVYVVRLNRRLRQAVVEEKKELVERKRAEEELRETSDFLEHLIGCANAPITVWDPASRITRFNRAFERMTGYAADEVIGRELSLLFPESSREESLSRIDRAVSGEHWESVEIPIRCKNGQTRFALWNSANIYSDDGATLLATIAQGIEITERKRAEEERATLQDQLHQAQKMEAIGQLAGGVAHDFNTLLTAITGYSALAKATLSEDHKAIRLLEGVEEAAEQAAGVTNSLLTLSRKTIARKRPVELRGLIEKSVRLLHRVLPVGIEVVTDTSGESPVWVHADSTQVQQVVMNLAINARDAMPEGGTLRVSVSGTPADVSESVAGAASDTPALDSGHQGPVARLVVSDTGVGMSSEVRDRIFEPFFTTKARDQGTGLGLAIIHGIAKDHGGRIEVQSEPGRGTTFTVVLPSLEEDAIPEAAESPPAARSGQGELILLAEDNRHVRGIVVASLESFDYEVLAASNGASLMEYFERDRTRVRLLVIDVDLPKRSGLDCLREIRAGGFRTPAIIITGGVDTDLGDQLDEDTLLLSKPFQMSELGTLVGSILGTRGSREDQT